jgi:maltose alpha-D-glucosyltransferase/alpha-amylase
MRVRVLGNEQSNTTINYSDRLVLKLFRLLEEGTNPDVEMTQYLTEVRGFSHVPALTGSLEYRSEAGGKAEIGMLQEFVPNQGDAWCLALDSLDRAFERVPALEAPAPSDAELGVTHSLLARAAHKPPEVVARLISAFLPLVELLGERTAELHRALAQEREQEAFRAEEFSTLYQRSLYQSARTGLLRSFHLLERRLATVPDRSRELANRVLEMRSIFDQRLRRIVGTKIDAVRIRTHGDYHLGQVLFTGNDFFIIDFEGEPTRSMGERRLKQSPLRDVAGMLRSFHYAAVAALQHGRQREGDVPNLIPWADAWHLWVQSGFLGAYLERTRGSAFIPKRYRELAVLLDFFLIEKCTYELAYELNNRPDWIEIPLNGLRTLAAVALTPAEEEEERRDECF